MTITQLEKQIAYSKNRDNGEVIAALYEIALQTALLNHKLQNAEVVVRQPAPFTNLTV